MKTKVLISFAVTAKLICAFVFAYAKYWFPHEEAQMNCLMVKLVIIGDVCLSNKAGLDYLKDSHCVHKILT